jgi:esterase/lipase superfamily enzyme
MGQTSEALVGAIAQIWPELPRMVEGDWGEFQSTVLNRLAVLDDAELAVAAAAGDDDKERAAAHAANAAQKDLWSLFSVYPTAHDRLNQLLVEAYKKIRGSAHPPAGSILYNAQLPFFEIPVFYATDRESAGRPEWYTGERASPEDLSYGVVKVSLPTDRKLGSLPTGMRRFFRVRFKTKPPEFNPQKYCEIMSVDPESVSGFVEKAATAAQPGHDSADGAGETSGPHDVLVFIHGYNVSFDAAARRAAQLAYDLDFTGVIVLYSWPSGGTLAAYPADGNSAEWSTPHLVQFLWDVLPKIGARQIHVVAHSMGNQVLARALDRAGRSARQRLGHIVFVAPDVDAGVFAQWADGFGDLAESYTLYMSSKDLALRVSGIVGGYVRAGYSVENLATKARIEIVDASRLPKTDALGHSGFAENRTMLNDLKDILRYGRTADKRSGIEPRSDPDGHRYWMFPA